MQSNYKTDPTQLIKLLIHLDNQGISPHFIPLTAGDKTPDLPVTGGSTLDTQFKLTSPQAIQRLYRGGNVGLFAGPLVIWDNDDLQLFQCSKPTFCVKTRNGGLQHYYLNDGTIEKTFGKAGMRGAGEIRTGNWYVVAPGSFVHCNNGKGDGCYRVIKNIPLETLNQSDLTDEWRPNKTEITSTPTINNHNKISSGYDLEYFRKIDPKLNSLLTTNSQDNSRSEDDMALLSKLYFYGYNKNEAVNVLRQYRNRPKLNREDYINNTWSKIAFGERYNGFNINQLEFGGSKNNQ
ncbi:MAG: hypothetical protein LBH74_09955 [Nitrososphaerota archaeon]|jgi:hypothetical protein|nr:hypothetical protein [Nitrososphaerota archaeon]